MTATPAHWIKPNEAARIPQRHIVVDTEARYSYEGKAQLQSWRCGVADFTHRTNRGIWHIERREYTDAAELWRDVGDFTRPRRRTVLWAHNLAYDLRVGRTLTQLPRQGWELVDIRLASQGTWAKFTRGGRSLILADSASVWPVKLATIGAALGVGKPGLPATDDLEAWLHRCRVDVDILRSALIGYLDWLRAAEIGSWQMTGAGQAWSHWRHRHYTHRVLVGDDERARNAERAAIWTGRAEAWSYGADPTATVYDFDWENAYPRIARDVDLPVRPHSVSRGVKLATVMQWTQRFAVLAECHVTTDQPVVPAPHEGRIVWPVGTFDTVLWDPELALLDQAGAQVQIGRMWLYRKAPALRDWASWVLTHTHCSDDCHPPYLRLVIKHWSRALIGRFAMRYTQWEPYARSPIEDVSVTDGWDRELDRAFRLLQVGHQVYEATEEVDSDNAAPMVTGYVASEARAKLWRVAQLVGPEHVHYIDTDSLLVSPAGRKRILELGELPDLDGLRVKRRFRGYDIAGPRQLVLGGQPRISGVPRGARRVDARTWEGEVWRGLGESVRRGEPDQVRVTTRTFHIKYVDRRRVRLGDGRTAPIRLELGDQDRGQGERKSA